jgi:hypothetical protein
MTRSISRNSLGGSRTARDLSFTFLDALSANASSSRALLRAAVVKDEGRDEMDGARTCRSHNRILYAKTSAQPHGITKSQHNH